MGEQDALPSTQDAFPIAEPQVIITPQVSSGRAVNALMKFLPREVMVEVVDPSREEPREPKARNERGERNEEEKMDAAIVAVSVVAVSPIVELALAVAAKADSRVVAELVDKAVSPADSGTPDEPQPPAQSSRKAKSRLDRRRPLAAERPTVVVEPVAEVASSEPAADFAEAAPPASSSPIAELAQVVESAAVLGEAGVIEMLALATGVSPEDSVLSDASVSQRLMMTTSPAGPSSPLSAFDFSRLSSFADDPPWVWQRAGSSHFPLSKRLSHLAHLLVPDFLGRLIQHPILQILAGIGVSLLVLWWILGQ